MKTASRVLLASLALGAAGLGCQDNWQTFFIQDNKRLGEAPECAIPVDETATAIISGVMDVSVRDHYTGYLFVSNAMIAREDDGLPRAESNGIFVQGAYLYYQSDPNLPSAVYPDQEVRFSGYVRPGSSFTIGVPLVPTGIGTLLRSALGTGTSMQIVVTAQLFGITQSGIEVLTQEFDFPITVCNGCLVFCPPGFDTQPLVAGCQCNCTMAGSGVDPEEAPCMIGQDDLVDCRLLCSLTG